MTYRTRQKESQGLKPGSWSQDQNEQNMLHLETQKTWSNIFTNKDPKNKETTWFAENEQGNRASVTEIITSRVFWSNKIVTKISLPKVASQKTQPFQFLSFTTSCRSKKFSAGPMPPVLRRWHRCIQRRLLSFFDGTNREARGNGWKLNVVLKGARGSDRNYTLVIWFMTHLYLFRGRKQPT